MNSTQCDFLDFAGNMLERVESRESNTPDFFELAGVRQHGQATASGLYDYDYQNLSESLSLYQQQLTQVQTVSKIPIPPEILENFKHIKCHCMMGLFPEISRAWLTIDSEIYIWTYEKVRDVAYYDGLQNLILSVGLVKPRAGVFIDDVKHLLVLTTPMEVIVLGVTFSDETKIVTTPLRNMPGTSNFEEMQLMNKPIFIVDTENVPFNVVQGSNDGRLFLGGRDGCLYEISYQAESSWFGKRCKKINHSQTIYSYMIPSFLKAFKETDAIMQIEIDNNRQLLYVLTEKGCIEIWNMAGNGMKRIIRVTANEIANEAGGVVKTLDTSVFKTVKSICALFIEDTPGLHLLAITQTGVRLFFTTSLLQAMNIKTDYQQRMEQRTQQMSLQTANAAGAANNNNNQPPPNQCNDMASNCDNATQHLQGLFLLHVRLPPGYTPNTTISKPKQVHAAYFNDGNVLFVSTPQQDQDLLWSFSSAPFPNRPYLAESASILPLDGIVWNLAELHESATTKLSSLLRRAQQPKKVVLLTNQGAHIIALLKPADILKQLLMACHGPQHEAVKAFFQLQTEREACATCLLLVCSQQYCGTDIAMWASQAFLLYGGEPVYQHLHEVTEMQQLEAAGIHSRNSVNMPVVTALGYEKQNSPPIFMSTPMAGTKAVTGATPTSLPPLASSSNLQNSTLPYNSPSYVPHSLFGNQYSFSQSNINAKSEVGSQIIYSAKHDSLYIHLSRLLRPIWKMRCIDANLRSSLTKADCSLILEDLYALKSFLQAHSVNELSLPASTMRFYNQQQRQQQQSNIQSNGFNHLLQHSPSTSTYHRTTDYAQIDEKRSLTALNYFIKHACEMMALWKILVEHEIHLLVHQLTKEQQSVLASSTFRDLIVAHSDLAALLIVALINSYLKDNASVSLISTKLRELCPNLYRHEDAVSFKATEILITSKNCTASEERNEKLLTALQLCKDAAPTLPLQNICQQFTLCGFYEGVIELSVTCAIKIDPEEYAIHYYNIEEPTEDREGFAAYAARMNCYKEVRAMLDHVYQKLYSNTTTQQDYTMHQLSANDNGSESVLEPKGQIMNIVNVAVRNKDPLLHVSIYDWLMAHDMYSELLSLTEPSLGEFLRRLVVRQPGNLKLIDLLWKYYEKNGHHAQAARILDNLATTPSEAIPLTQRIEYLARAVMCMRNDSVGYSAANGMLLKELEDKLEIARVQKAVLNAINELTPTNRDAAKAVNELNFTLYDITQLYQNFAEPYNLWECKLTILHCSRHNDILLIESVWSNIINKCVESGGTVQERSTKLFSKVETLAKELGETGQCFPLAFIIHELEVKACQLRLPQGTVPEKLTTMNLDMELLMEYYTRMIAMGERIWANEGNQWHLVQSSIRLIALLADNGQTLWYRSKRRVVGKAQDIVSMCLNLCYQKPGTDRLQKELKELQCRLQRIVS